MGSIDEVTDELAEALEGFLDGNDDDEMQDCAMVGGKHDQDETERNQEFDRYNGNKDYAK